MAIPPSVTITLALDPKTYSYTSSTPPTLSLRVTSHATQPVTLFTWNTPLNLPAALSDSHYTITDTRTSTPIPQTMTRVQRMPFSRARGSSDERYFLTLYPSTPVTLSAGFSRAGGQKGRPQPKEVVQRGWMIDEEGRERKGIRVSTLGCGVDGLESGQTYRVDVKMEALESIWWRWGEKADVQVEKGSLEWNLSCLKPDGRGLKVGEIEGVDFEIV